mmetsp:Transcript_4052/g.10511  ORF Transcript_4052/g.10511 Transcript_4052/m.10511 type:complete len:280 (-) Transcript_4052:3-842(-)|eukprot:CAMPEP_0115862444 /NCGR_PEP_ID=MMETSP0287-20121206/18176_1 /TAXON_ID=412157 /ORGANISM="Chrysochromulina rotalis, Strain UIO044" /LENGTH=279 /DNA_ID=CAMNT_0003316859 /DNA_START=20 /DNA_END=859 /DNA_ORIENTATION=+
MASVDRSRTDTGSLEPNPGQVLTHSEAASQFQFEDDAQKMEVLELIAKSAALNESLKGSLAAAAKAGEAVNAAFANTELAGTEPASTYVRGAASLPAAPPDLSGAASSSSALARARHGNAETITKVRSQLEESLGAQETLQRDLENERARRVAADAKLEEMRAALESAGIPVPADLPPSPERSSSFSGDRLTVDVELERLHLDAVNSIGEPKTPSEFVQRGVAGMLAGTASNAVKLLNTLTRSPVSSGSSSSPKDAKPTPWAVGAVSASSETGPPEDRQ